MEGVIRQAARDPLVEDAAPAVRPPCEKFAPFPAPEAENLQELLLELGWQGHPVGLWPALRVLGWLLPSPSEQERIYCLLNLCQLPYGIQLLCSVLLVSFMPAG